MPRTATCLLCGRGFEPRGRGTPGYCAQCAARAARKAARPPRVECRECGRKFSARGTPARYCSDPCRKKGHARARRDRLGAEAARRRRRRASSARPARGAPPPSPPRCRVCSSAIPAARRLGRSSVYCSDACRAKGRLKYSREYMRRYREDPERRAVQAARNRAARPRAPEARVSCRACGRDFTTAIQAVVHCGRCRKRRTAYRKGGASARRPKQQPPRGTATTAKCRVCSRKFDSFAGRGRLHVYCSDACRADGLRAYQREYMRRYRVLAAASASAGRAARKESKGRARGPSSAAL